MMLLVRIVAGLHLAVYLGIMWYGWQSYKLLRKRSWRFMGIGFTIFLVYRIDQFIEQLVASGPMDTEGTLIPFIASLFLLTAFWMLHNEHYDLISKLADSPSPLRSGAQPVEFWISESRKRMDEIRQIVKEEIAAASGTTTVTVKGPASTALDPDAIVLKEK